MDPRPWDSFVVSVQWMLSIGGTVLVGLMIVGGVLSLLHWFVMGDWRFWKV